MSGARAVAAAGLGLGVGVLAGRVLLVVAGWLLGRRFAVQVERGLAGVR